MRKIGIILLLLLTGCRSGLVAVGGRESVQYWQEHRLVPVPVLLSIARVDLHAPDVEVAVFIADDPDGDGPAESKLVHPQELATRHGALVAVNANAFGALPDEEGNRSQHYIQGMPVEIAGFAAADGVRRSEAYVHAGNDHTFWICGRGTPRIGGVPAAAEDVKHGVNAWWGHLLEDGRILPRVGGDRHPRTAVGYDQEGRWLFLVVADGRQQGHSEGLTLHELAGILAELGAAHAINLDGGGSSIMLVADDEDGSSLRVVNQPSAGVPRPVPVMLGVRPRSVEP